MPTVIQQSNLSELPLVPTSALTLLSAQTTEPSLTVAMHCGVQSIFSAKLYTLYGKVEFHDPASLIEQFMRDNHRFIARIEIIFGTEAITLNCLYSDYDLPLDTDFSATFLTLLPAQRTHPGSVVTIAVDTQDAITAATVKALGTDPEGHPLTHTLDHTVLTQKIFGLAEIDVSALIAKVKEESAMTKVTSFTVNSGSRQKSLFISPDPDYLTFRFRSCFNVPETVDISGVSVMKTEVSRDVATCSGRTLHYDRHTSRTYEHTTGPLTRIEAAALAQLVESRAVSLLIDGTEYPVLITDHTSEVTDDNSTLNTLKFTWRFTGNRPRLFGSTLRPLLDESKGIFTEPFTPEYQ